MKRESTLKHFMRSATRNNMKGYPTYHSNCIHFTGVARPGKTARDKARREGKS